MSKIAVIFLMLFFGAIVVNASAQNSREMAVQNDLDKYQKKISAFNDQINTFSISGQAFYNHYGEPQKARRVTGVWRGIESKYVFRPEEGNVFYNPFFNFFALEGLYATGKSDLEEDLARFYTDNSVTKQNQKNIPGYMFENRALMGRSFLPLDFVRLTPYVGFGIRYKTEHAAGHEDILDDGSPYLGDDHSETYYYIPTGLTFDLAVNKDYTISMNAEYDYLLKGYEKIEYSDYDTIAIPSGSYPNSNIRFSQDHGWGGRFSLKFLMHFSCVNVYVEPYLRYWHLDASKAASGFLFGDPFTATANKNSTIEVGSSLGIQF